MASTEISSPVETAYRRVRLLGFPDGSGYAPRTRKATELLVELCGRSKSKWLVGAFAVVVLGGCGSSGSASPATVSIPSSARASSAPTLAPESTSVPAAAPTTAAPPTDAPTEDRATAAPVASGFIMPNEVGVVLQTAQDDLQRVSGNPLYYSSSSDASGQSRMQILDRNWKVCSQSSAPGVSVGDSTTVDFAVVKLEETCP
jgi:hypothetical protein